MNDESLKQMFDSLPVTPNAEAKARARAAALQAFDEVHTEKRTIGAADQGSIERQRPTPESTKPGSNIMYATFFRERQNLRQQAGLAAAAMLLILGSVIALQRYQQDDSGPSSASARVEPADRNLRSEPRKGEESEQPTIASTTEASSVDGVSTASSASSTGTNAPSMQPTGAASASESPTRAAKVAKNTVPPLRVATAEAPQPSPEEVVVRGFRREEALNAIAMSISPMIDTGPLSKSRAESRDRFTSKTTNPIKRVSAEPVSTFSIDVDTAAYSFVRRQLKQGALPDKDAVRLEEMVNYFPYAYAPPKKSNRPFSTQVTVIDSPWKAGNKLVHIGIKGYELPGSLPKSNLVFLLDVSGSMQGPDRLPLVKQSMTLLLSRLQPEDTVAIVVYAGAAGTVLEPTAVKDKEKILAALNTLEAGGSTAGGEGIVRAYQLAESSFIKEGVNRIILATDGDFNVGVSDPNELQQLIEGKRKTGVFLSVLGVGEGNYNDELMQKLAQNGNGVAAYIDTAGEAQKVLVEEATSTLFPIAKDVKIQVEFNPATVSEYRLLGYETRMLAEEDFNNDAVDAGDIGSGHTVTAIYEITPVGSESATLSPSRYSAAPKNRGKDGEYGFLKLRYKTPKGFFSRLIEEPIRLQARADGVAQREASFASAVAGFAQLLQGGKYLGEWNYDSALELAQANRGEDPFGYRAELVELIRKAKAIDGK